MTTKCQADWLRSIYACLHDPSGVNAAESIRETIMELAPEVDLRFERLAVTKDQIDRWNLPSRATVWRRVADGTIPKPVRIHGMSRWPQSEIAGVIEQAKAQRSA